MDTKLKLTLCPRAKEMSPGRSRPPGQSQVTVHNKEHSQARLKRVRSPWGRGWGWGVSAHRTSFSCFAPCTRPCLTSFTPQCSQRSVTWLDLPNSTAFLIPCPECPSFATLSEQRCVWLGGVGGGKGILPATGNHQIRHRGGNNPRGGGTGKFSFGELSCIFQYHCLRHCYRSFCQALQLTEAETALL